MQKVYTDRVITLPYPLLTANDLITFVKNSSPHVKTCVLSEHAGSAVIITIKLEFWYGLFFRAAYRRWITPFIDAGRPITVEPIILITI